MVNMLFAGFDGGQETLVLVRVERVFLVDSGWVYVDDDDDDDYDDDGAHSLPRSR